MITLQPLMDARIIPHFDVASLETPWRGLEAGADISFFQSWTWVGSWLRSIPDRSNLLQIELRKRGVLVGLAVLGFRTLRRVRILPVRTLLVHETGNRSFDGLTIEHNGIVTARGQEGEAFQAMVSCLAKARMPWDELRVNAINDDTAGAYANEFQLDPFVLSKGNRRACYMVALDEVRRSTDGHCALLSANSRAQLRRSLREYEARGPLGVHIAGDVSDALDVLADLVHAHQSRWQALGKGGAFASAFSRQFHRELVETGMPRGEIQLARVASGASPIGFLYNFVFREVVSNYQSGTVYEADNRLKPGLVCHHLVIEANARNGARTYDFLMGDQRFKKSLATGESGMWDLVVQRPRVRFAIERFARRVHRGLTRKR